MLLKIACFMLLFVAFFVVIVNSTGQKQMQTVQITKYTKIKDKTVASVRAPILRLSEPYRVRELTECPLRCNRLSNCQAVTINETFHCTLFSDLITLLDLEDLIGTLMMVKIPIQDCADPEYFLDWIGMVCRLKFDGLMACSRDKECSGSRGLICTGGICQCKMSNEKYEVI